MFGESLFMAISMILWAIFIPNIKHLLRSLKKFRTTIELQFLLIVKSKTLMQHMGSAS